MTPQELKASILQLAIQGKLVEQRPEEGTGAELLAKILAASTSAKASVDKKGAGKNLTRRRGERGVPSSHVSHLESSHAVEKISAHATLPSKNISAPSASPREEIPDSEKPFDIPESWVWCRVGDVFSHNTGKAMNSSAKQSNKKGAIRKFITTSNLYWNSFDFTSVKEMFFSDDELARCTATKGDILMCEGGAYYGRTAIWNLDYDICFQNHVHRLRAYVPVSNEYFYYVFYLYRNTGMMSPKGTAMPGLSSVVLHNLVIPLPPLAEQKRIVAKIEELLPYIDRYEKAWSKLEEFNKRFPGDMQKSLLQMAIQGKLVEQRPDEGTGEELYRQIQSEKQRLIKSGKIKKEKPLPEITPDEIPFDIPESWKWVRLGEICKSIADGDHQPPPQVPSGIPFLVISNVSKGTLDFSNTRFVPMAYFNSLSGERIPGRGDILFTVTGSYGIPLKIDINRSFCFQRHMALLKLLTNREYLFYALMSPVVQKQCDNAATGTAQKTVGLNALRNLLIPLPPLAEQKRIVAKLEELLPLCERLK